MVRKTKKQFYQTALNQKGGALNELLENAHMFQALLELGRDGLPAPLNAHLIGAFFEENVLILQIDHSVWATQLRFYEPNILGVFQHNLPHLNLQRVKVKVIPQTKEPEKKGCQMEPLSTENALQMRELSEHIESDNLKHALQKLSNCRKRKT